VEPDALGDADLVKAGKLRHYGVSVEKVEEALKAIEYPRVQSVQIVCNLFRQRPAKLPIRETLARRLGILARPPLSSRMPSGRLRPSTEFARDGHEGPHSGSHARHGDRNEA